MTPRLLVLAQALDAASLAAFYALGLAGTLREQNPLVLGLMALGGVPPVALAKVGVSLAALRRWRSVRHGAALRLALGAAVLSGCVGAGANTASILWSLGVRA